MDPKEELALRKDQLAARSLPVRIAGRITGDVKALPGYAANVEALKARIAELEAQV